VQRRDLAADHQRERLPKAAQESLPYGGVDESEAIRGVITDRNEDEIQQHFARGPAQREGREERRKRRARERREARAVVSEHAASTPPNARLPQLPMNNRAGG